PLRQRSAKKLLGGVRNVRNSPEFGSYSTRILANSATELLKNEQRDSMSATDTASPPQKRSVLRAWFPAVVLVLAVLAVVAVWSWPAEWDRMHRVMGIWYTALASILLLSCWLMGWSGLGWPTRLAIILGVPLLCVAVIRRVDFTGDMVPVITFRW